MIRPLYEIDPDALNVPWLESPFTDVLLEASGLPEEQLSQCATYARRGYAVVDAAYPEAALDTIRARLEGCYRPGGAPGDAAPDRIQDAWAIDDSELRQAVLAVACHEPVLELLRMLYRREPIPFQTLHFARGTEQHTHSDTVHFHCEPARFMCGVWVALEDVHPDSGPLHYYPASHRLPIYTPSDLGFTPSFPDTVACRQEVTRAYDRFVQSMVRAQGLQRETFRARRGQALVWAANLLHGGDPIGDARLSRHSMVTHYMFEDGFYYTPFDSDVAVGRFALREIVDLRTGESVAQTYRGIETRAFESGPVRVRAPLERAEPPGLTLRTERALRILAWPRFEHDDDLAMLADCLERVLAHRDDACLCLRLDPATDGTSREAAVRRLEALLAQVSKQGEVACELLLVDDPVPAVKLADLHDQVTAALLLPSTDLVRLGYLSRVRRPVLRGPDALEDALLGA